MGQQFYEEAWDLPGTSPEPLRELLSPQWTSNQVGGDWGRISQQIKLGFLKGKDGSASSLPTDIQSILVTTSAWAITIPVTLYKTENGKITETTTLVNSGATICCIDLHLARRTKWPLEKLWQPIYARNTNGTNNSGGMICYQVKFHWWSMEEIQNSISSC